MSHLKITSIKICILFIFLNGLKASAQNKSIILGRPTDSSITASILFNQNVEYFIEYGTTSSSYPSSTIKNLNTANIPNGMYLLVVTSTNSKDAQKIIIQY
jgi:hypothetical protein